MTTFEVGFVDYAKENGLSEKQAAHFLKRAFEYPGTQGMFDTLPYNEQEQSPESLESLMHLFKQEDLHNLLTDEHRKIHLE
jgi:hypothetical protein